MPNRPPRHLRDAAAICPDSSPCPGGDLRCERDAGHDGKHKDGCTHWGQTNAETAAES
ncbi:hypothetical protein ACWGVR_14185 [Streptomyces xanthophaeus]